MFPTKGKCIPNKNQSYKPIRETLKSWKESKIWAIHKRRNTNVFIKQTASELQGTILGGRIYSKENTEFLSSWKKFF